LEGRSSGFRAGEIITVTSLKRVALAPAKNRVPLRPYREWIMRNHAMSGPCPECGQKNLYRTRANSGGGHAPNYLPGLGGFIAPARFEVVVCADCGLTRWFASPEARNRLDSAQNWVGNKIWSRL
jgi:hypothetical protein